MENKIILLQMAKFRWEDLSPLTKPIEMERAPDVQERYNEYKKFLYLSNITLHSHLFSKFFSFNHPLVLSKNEYPYCMEGMEHYLLWINPRFSITRHEIHQVITSLFPYELVYFENKKELRSVPSLRHIHVLVRV